MSRAGTSLHSRILLWVIVLLFTVISWWMISEMQKIHRSVELLLNTTNLVSFQQEYISHIVGHDDQPYPNCPYCQLEGRTHPEGFKIPSPKQQQQKSKATVLPDGSLVD